MVHGVWIRVSIGADGGRDGGQLLGRGSVPEHVTARHQGEFGCREQPVTDDELVGGPSPGRRRGPFSVNTGAPCRDQDDVALASRDQRGCIENRRNSQRAGPSGARSKTQFKNDLRAVGTDHTVNLVRGDAGVGERAQGGNQCDRRRVMVGEPARLHGVVNTGNGDVAKRV